MLNKIEKMTFSRQFYLLVALSVSLLSIDTFLLMRGFNNLAGAGVAINSPEFNGFIVKAVSLSFATLFMQLGAFKYLVCLWKNKIGGEFEDVTHKAALLNQRSFHEPDNKVENSILSHIQSGVSSLNLLSDSISSLHERHNEGHINDRISLDGYPDFYAGIVRGVNSLVDKHVQIIKNTSVAIEAISKGDVSTKVEKFPAELSVLNHSFDHLKENISTLITNMRDVANRHTAGEIGAALVPSDYSGEFGVVASIVNGMVEEHLSEKAQLISVMDQIGRGNLEVELAQMPGDKAVMNKSVDRIKGNLKGIVDSVNWVNNEHEKGNIDILLRADLFKGHFALVAESVNQLLHGHLDMNKKAMDCFKEFGQGNFNAPLEKFVGKKAEINVIVENVRHNLKSLNEDAQMLAQAAKEGRVKVRANAANHPGDFGLIVSGMNSTLDMIVSPIITTKQAAEAISSAAKEITEGNSDLSRRTEDQAASLQKTTESMDNLAVTVRQNADNAKQAKGLALEASEVAQRGGSIVNSVVLTMENINKSAKKIEDIISVIDGIAFQTNILALNAAVEAARAGEQGRGFAVVADEVRNLAQRSAGAAKEIKELISDSVKKTAEGSKQVQTAGSTMEEILVSVNRVNGIVSEIAIASAEQSEGITHINEAIIKMDDMTQQNTALVEEAAAASASLMEQVNELNAIVSVFNLED